MCCCVVNVLGVQVTFHMNKTFLLNAAISRLHSLTKTLMVRFIYSLLTKMQASEDGHVMLVMMRYRTVAAVAVSFLFNWPFF